MPLESDKIGGPKGPERVGDFILSGAAVHAHDPCHDDLIDPQPIVPTVCDCETLVPTSSLPAPTSGAEMPRHRHLTDHA